MMTATEIANHNEICASLTAEDGIPRLTWEQHGAAFKQPVPTALTTGQQVVAWDSSTPGTIGELRDGRYDVTFSDLEHRGGPCRYPASQLRPWPTDLNA